MITIMIMIIILVWTHNSHPPQLGPLQSRRAESGKKANIVGYRKKCPKKIFIDPHKLGRSFVEEEGVGLKEKVAQYLLLRPVGVNIVFIIVIIIIVIMIMDKSMGAVCWKKESRAIFITAPSWRQYCWLMLADPPHLRHHYWHQHAPNDHHLIIIWSSNEHDTIIMIITRLYVGTPTASAIIIDTASTTTMLPMNIWTFWISSDHQIAILQFYPPS